MKFDKQVWALVASVLQLVAGSGHLILTWTTDGGLRDLFWPFLIPLLVTSTGEGVSLYYSYMTDEASMLPDVALAIAIMWIMYMEERLQFSLFDLVSNYRYVALPIFGVGMLLMVAYVVCLMLEATSLSSISNKEYFLAFGCISHRAFIVLAQANSIISTVRALKLSSQPFWRCWKTRRGSICLIVCVAIALILTIVIAFYPYSSGDNQCLYLYLFFLAIAIIYLMKIGWTRRPQPKQGVPPANYTGRGSDSTSTSHLVEGPGNQNDLELGRGKVHHILRRKAYWNGTPEVLCCIMSPA
ncbi:hypothetical protein EDB81DRAFT_361041 [Dactylonectria macrodidyma]|uniref:Uncharacterized protein n=1 Tax=Dactylonectria macrodidyma TaxID=307937 RepID=A0A9P9D2W2_9HYPO|nr:hypothetical protein EDB81DRAFT_361041 [Dactylonectria macrodidyma]